MHTILNSEVLLEFILTFLYLVPISLFRYIPFIRKFRFSIKQTALFYFLFFFAGNLILAWNGKYDSFTMANRYRFVLYFFMTLFSFVLIKERIGKQLYAICFFANYSFLFSAASLIPEAIIYGKSSYHLLFKVFGMLLVLILAMPLIYHFAYKPLAFIISRKIPVIWSFLWIAGIIQLLLNAFLSVPYQSENILAGRNAGIRIFISIGSILLNHIILYLIKSMLHTYDANIALESEKQQLLIQKYQYHSIQEQIKASQRFRHDFKHHSAIISSIVVDSSLTDSEKLAKLTTYCQEYFGSIPEAEEQNFCEHYPLNLILNYYYTKSIEIGYSYSVKIDVPSHMAIPDTDICVIVGNLLLNALEAVTIAPKDFRQIHITMKKTANNLLILVENGFNGQLNQSHDTFHSTKHEGDGIGIPSIRNITSKYHGTCYFEHHENIFSAKIHLVLKY